MKRTGLPALLVVIVLTFIYAGYVAYPLLQTVRESVMVNGRWTFSNYLSLFTFEQTGNIEAVWNSVAVSLLSVLCSGLLGSFLAFVLTQVEVPLRAFLSRLAILPVALPPLVGVIAFLFVFGESGIVPRAVYELFGAGGGLLALDGFPAIVAVHTYSFNVYFYLFVAAGLERLDAAQLEAARSLGASTGRILRRVVIPELTPALMGASILTFMASMASFSAPLLFGGERRFMTLQIYNAKLNGELDVAATQAVLLTVVSIVFFIALRSVSRVPAAGRRSKGAGHVGVVPLGRGAKRTLALACVGLLFLEALPIVAIALISFAQEGAWTWQILPVVYTLENYAKLLAEPGVFDPIVNSIVMSIVAVAACVLVGGAGAYILTKGILRPVRFPADVALTVPFAVPGTVIALGLILAFNTPTVLTGNSVLVGTFWILPLAYFMRMFPLVVRSTSASLDMVDDSLIEAGTTFGAGPWRRFRKIVLPLIVPGIVSGALLVMISALGEFVSSILLYTYSNRPVSVEILAQMRMYNFGSAAAYSVFLLLLIGALAFVSRFAAAGRGDSRRQYFG